MRCDSCGCEIDVTNGHNCHSGFACDDCVCIVCEGSGSCEECDGTGECDFGGDNCSVCNGSGECMDCDGLGRDPDDGEQ